MFVAVSCVAAVTALAVNLVLAAGLAGLAGFFVFVFRDPSRRPGEGIVAPADGIVREIDEEKGMVSIYLALRNVHVTRAPIAGTVKASNRVAGRHRPAFSMKSPHNERLELELETDIGNVTVIQMAGMLARRIVPYIGRGSAVMKADRLALIRFGSRVDIYLPADRVFLRVATGERVRAGVTCVAEVRNERAE